MADLEQRNAWLAAQQRECPLPEVLADWRAVNDRLVAQVEAATEEELASLVRVTPTFDIVPATDTGEGDTWRLRESIAGQTCRHPHGHYRAVRTRLEART